MSFTFVEPFEYRGFVLLPELVTNRLIGASCEEISFEASGTCYFNHIVEFKKMVDEVLMNKVFSYLDAKKELNLLKTRLEEEPAKFYRTHQVHNLITLAEDLLAAFIKSEKEDPTTKQFHYHLDQLIGRASRQNYDAETIYRKIVEIQLLFGGVLNISLDDVKRLYFERASKVGEKE